MRSFISILFASILAVGCGGAAPDRSPTFHEPAAATSFDEAPFDGVFANGSQDWHPDGCAWDDALSLKTIGTDRALIIDAPNCYVTSSPTAIPPDTTSLRLNGEFSALDTPCADDYCAALLVRTYSTSLAVIDRTLCYVAAGAQSSWASATCISPVSPGATYYSVTIMGANAPVIPIGVRRVIAYPQDAANVMPSK